jgi:hypothetical protein
MKKESAIKYTVNLFLFDCINKLVKLPAGSFEQEQLKKNIFLFLQSFQALNITAASEIRIKNFRGGLKFSSEEELNEEELNRFAGLVAYINEYFLTCEFISLPAPEPEPIILSRFK